MSEMPMETKKDIFWMWMRRLQEIAGKLQQKENVDDDYKQNYNKCLRIIDMLKKLNDDNGFKDKDLLITMIQILMNKRASCEIMLDELNKLIKYD